MIPFAHLTGLPCIVGGPSMAGSPHSIGASRHGGTPIAFSRAATSTAPAEKTSRPPGANHTAALARGDGFRPCSPPLRSSASICSGKPCKAWKSACRRSPGHVVNIHARWSTPLPGVRPCGGASNQNFKRDGLLPAGQAPATGPSRRRAGLEKHPWVTRTRSSPTYSPSRRRLGGKSIRGAWTGDPAGPCSHMWNCSETILPSFTS